MRYLNKIIFINSAQIKYAEINLDGNVHFIGTQGVGKSTLLRAILFFYNADTLGLGIPRQKSAYVDYYFTHSNSYIIYEVVREDGKFCAVSYKSQHKVCFRFFSGEYMPAYFIRENGIVPDTWDSIAQQLDASKIFYTKRKIDEYKEYRDIIYGNHEGKKHELRRYSILESKDYQQVPKTIQNVFLNSKMEAEFIKQTIILSLDNDVRIDLNQYAHHLTNFETQLTDIRKFKMPSTSLQADTIAKFYMAIRHLEREKMQLAGELAWALNENLRIEPETEKMLNEQQEKETLIKTKLTRLKEIFDEKASKIRGDVCVLDENLKKAKKLNDEYERKNIGQLIAKVERKNDFEREFTHFQNEKSLLSAQFSDVELKFKALFEALDNRCNDFLNGKNAEKNQLNADFLKFKDNTYKMYEKQIAELREEHKKEMELVRADWEGKKQLLNDLRLKREQIKLARFFEDEITAMEKDIQLTTNRVKQLPVEMDNLTKQIETVQKQWELDSQNLLKDFERNNEKLDNQIAVINQKIVEIELYINNSKNSLYAWLTESYPNWENSIGKVIDEKNVLFNTSLNPRLTEQSGNFYGIEIDLNEIDKTVKTVADYETEKSALIAQIQSIKQIISGLFAKLDEDKEKLKKKYQPKIREKKDAIRENEYLLGQNKAKYIETSIQLNALKTKAQSERANQLATIESEIGKAGEHAKNAETKVYQQEEEQSRTIKAKEKERDKITGSEHNRLIGLLAEIDAEIKLKNSEINKQREELCNRKNKELSEKGADMQRIIVIEEKLQLLKQDLKFIDDNRDLVAEYRKDKRDLIDKTTEFKQEKQRLDRQLELENLKHEKQSAEIQQEQTNIQLMIAELTNQLTIIREDASEFEDFRSSECFKSIETQLLVSEMHTKTEKRVKVLINEIRTIYYEKLNKQKEDLRTAATDFLGKFSDDNIFKFEKQVASEPALLAFAEMLSDFIEERKIERIEKEVNERFALIVSTIGTETGNLMTESGKIQSIITKINNDFIEKNFVGVIKRIELKIEDSKNEIVQLLRLIKDYNDKNSMEFGAPNLFSSNEQDKKNKEAVDLLKQFAKKINEVKKDSVSLSDSFELKFRIEENQNDTNWVEKLSNVGSEGTDTLVKAMVNIMLLNVFKESVSKKFKDFRLHCMMDEIGKLHPNNVRGILKFANDRNILLINGSPIENDALAFTHIYKLHKDEKSVTKVKRLITQYPTS
ncbi:MAG: ATP-binding protein [Bacteroidales bacterium]|jgi:hypothetical protein|nr:ATP-binding protein [Bacteroidales bacterium]